MRTMEEREREMHGLVRVAEEMGRDHGRLVSAAQPQTTTEDFVKFYCNARMKRVSPNSPLLWQSPDLTHSLLVG